MQKDEIIEHVKDWIKVDEEIKSLQKLVREKKAFKKQNSEILIGVMKDNEIDCFDTNNGKLQYSVNKTKQCISKKFLLKTLETYFQNSPDKAVQLTNHILDQREEKTNESIKRSKPK